MLRLLTDLCTRRVLGGPILKQVPEDLDQQKKGGEIADMTKAVLVLTAWRLRGEATVLFHLVKQLTEHPNADISSRAATLCGPYRWQGIIDRFFDDPGCAYFLRVQCSAAVLLRGTGYRPLRRPNREFALPERAPAPAVQPAKPKKRTHRVTFSSTPEKHNSHIFKEVYDHWSKRRKRNYALNDSGPSASPRNAPGSGVLPSPRTESTETPSTPRPT